MRNLNLEIERQASEKTDHSKALSIFCLLALLTFVALSVGFSLTRAPWWDEGLFADVAINFGRFGHLGSTLLDPYGYLELPGVHQYTFWQFPLYLVGLGLVFKALHASVESMRLFSVLWGCVYLGSWYALTWGLTKSRRLALFVTAVVSLDYSVVAAASDGRMEMMCAALGLAALASYVCWRETNWHRAITLAGSLGAASLFCHPMGFVANGVLAAVVLFDRKRIRISALLLAAIPYLIGLCLCAIYASKAYDIFLIQSKAASAYRVSGVRPILQSVLNDFYLRYGHFYFLSLSGLNKLKVGSLLFPLAGLIAVASKRELRTSGLGRVLLIFVTVAYVGVAVIDNQKFPMYFVYVVPAMTACGAVWLSEEWPAGRLWRFVGAALWAGSILSTVGGFGEKIWKNDYKNLFNPAIAAVWNAGYPARPLMGGSELGFVLGFDSKFVDDRYLGQLSGKRADIYVVNGYYGGMGGPKLGEAWKASQKELRTKFRKSFENSAYQVFVREGT